MDYTTFISRDYRKAWKAETKIKLGDGWQLDITTRKTDNGDLSTSASMGKVERGFITHRMYADYNRNVFRRAARCTDKNVTAQHAEALAMLDTILADARAHHIKMGEPLPAIEKPADIIAA